MTRGGVRPTVATALALVIGCGMLAFGASKVIGYDTFDGQLRAAGIVPTALCGALAHFVPWLEIRLGVEWLLPPRRRVAAAVSLPLLLAFVAYHVVGIVLRRHASCACWGDRLGFTWLGVLIPVMFLAALVVHRWMDEGVGRRVDLTAPL